MRAALFFSAIGALAALASGCGCSKDKDDWEAGRPRIERLKFLQQGPQDPYALLFSITFTDSDGTISSGTLHMFINGTEAATQPMSEVFSMNQIDPGAASGEFEVVVRLENDFPTGQKVEVGFVLEDQGGECARSNEPTAVLEALMTPGGA